MKNEINTKTKVGQSTDVVLAEVWRIKEMLSASYGHNVHRLFAETREHEKNSGHPLVSLSDVRKEPAKEKAD